MQQTSKKTSTSYHSQTVSFQ